MPARGIFFGNITAAADQTVSPAAIALTVTAVAPTRVDQQVTPAAVGLTLAAVAPTVTQVGDATVSPAAVALTVTPVAPTRIDQELTPAALALTLALGGPRVDQQLNPAVVALSLALGGPQVDQSVQPGSLALTLTPVGPSVQLPQTVSPAALSLTLALLALSVAVPGSAPKGLTGAVEYVVELFDSGGTFGPNNKLGEIWDARNVGWSRYDRLPGKAFLTLYQDSPHLSKFQALITHVRITRITPSGDTEVYNGEFLDYDSTGDDVIITAFDYVSLLAVSRSGYRTLYPVKALGTEIAQVEVAAAIAATFSPLGFVTMGTVENPLGLDGTTVIKTNAQFGTLDQARLQLLYDLSEMGRANTLNHVTYEISRTSPFTFTFLKNKGSAKTIGLTLNGSVNDYEYLPNWGRYRNDIATLGTTVGGGATEIIKTNEAAAAVRGRRQDVATIKTLLGITSSAVEADQQQAATARMLQVAVQKTPVISLRLERGALAPFAGWDISDTLPMEIVNGIDSLTVPYRIAGVRALYTESGEDLALIMEPVLT